jgi:DNA-binding GntR family transcriptional regulator
MSDPSVRRHPGDDPAGAPGSAGSSRSTLPTATAVRDDLRRRITAGEFTGGQVLPDLDALRLQYQAEHSTVRRALHELAAEGVIVLNLQAIVAG